MLIKPMNGILLVERMEVKTKNGLILSESMQQETRIVTILAAEDTSLVGKKAIYDGKLMQTVVSGETHLMLNERQLIAFVED